MGLLSFLVGELGGEVIERRVERDGESESENGEPASDDGPTGEIDEASEIGETGEAADAGEATSESTTGDDPTAGDDLAGRTCRGLAVAA